jgi:hypothetical protein
MGRGVLRIEVTRAGLRGVGGGGVAPHRKKRFLSQPASHGHAVQRSLCLASVGGLLSIASPMMSDDSVALPMMTGCQ